MELRVLQYFLAVAREQSISGAAESLHLSQPTLSRKLRDMEEELGKQLMIRGNRRIILTEEGMILQKRAGEIMELVRKTENEIALSDNSVSGDVYIGAGETDGVRLIVKAAQCLQCRYPDIHYHISSGDTVDVIESLDKGLIDFGLLFTPVDHSKYDYLPLPMRDVWGILMRRDSELAAKEAITPKDLWDKPLIISRHAKGGSQFSSWIGRPLEELNIVATYSLLFNGSLMVDEGMGYALCLDKIINTSGLCFRPLSPAMDAEMNMIWKKYQLLSKAAQKFLQKLQEFVVQ